MNAQSTCRVCGSERLTHLFTLGDQFVSDFVTADRIRAAPICEIALQLCQCCHLIQQKYTAPQEFMYFRHYWYRSGINEQMVAELRELVAVATDQVHMEKGDVILDIGANDGTLLANFNEDAVTRVAVEPAVNLKEECKRNCDILISDFWSEKAYAANLMFEDGYKKAKIVFAIGMFYDLPDPNQFIADIAKVLHPEGVFVAQLMCAKQMIKKGDIGNLVHEHLEFYTLNSLVWLFSKHGLEMYDIEENDVNGGSYRIFVRHNHGVSRYHVPAKWKEVACDGQDPGPVTSIALAGAFQTEEDMGLAKVETWTSWFAILQDDKRKLVNFVRAQQHYGAVWIYGASTKGNALLQWWNLTANQIEAACDRSPEKIGKYTIGTGIPILGETAMRAANPKYLLVLPYAFISTFMRRELEWFKNGGTFIVPLPRPHLVRFKGLTGDLDNGGGNVAGEVELL